MLRERAFKVASQYKLGPIFTPPVVSQVGGPLGTLIINYPFGGTNWPGGSFDPQTHIYYVFSQGTVGSLGLIPPEPGSSEARWVVGIASAGEGGFHRLTVDGLPLLKPPYGKISAIDLDTGEIRWQIPHGEAPDEIRNSPALKGLTIPRTGRPGMIGVLTTRTLVIAGEGGEFTNAAGQKGALLRAYDKATGKDAGAVSMPSGQTGSPMTYFLKGKQYIVVAIGGPEDPGELLAFCLDTEKK
jgi:quinoprotein glucose dehydrogenase